METKKLVVQLTENIKEQKLKFEKDSCVPGTHGVEEKYISLNKQMKICAIYKLLYENWDLTKADLEKILRRRPVLFSYYRYLLKKYPNFIYSIKAAGPSYYIMKEAHEKIYKTVYDMR